MRFKGQHQGKRIITYKNEEDRFQADILCQKGFTYQIFMRKDPEPPTYFKQGLSPFYYRTMALFDQVNDEYHHQAMDNLYNSVPFCKQVYNHPKKVFCYGVTLKGMRDIPKEVFQDQVINRNDQIKVRGTVNASVLKGDTKCPDLVSTSVYDTNPVNFLSMTCKNLMWTVKEKLVYNVDTGLVEVLRFLRMNNIDAYNNDMGRGTYRCYIGVCSIKWWWSICFWELCLMLVNVCVMYCVFLMLQRIEKKNYCQIMISESLLLWHGSILCTKNGVVRRLILLQQLLIILSIFQ